MNGSFRFLSLIVTCFTLLFSSVSSATNLRVVGLFQNKALVLINGKRHFIQVGKETIKGVQLVSASSKKAVIEVNGIRTEYYLSRDMGQGITTPEILTFRVTRTPQGQYITRGSVNGRSTEMLVDTGANLVAMNSGEADRLGLSYKDGEKIFVETAGGITEGYKIRLDYVSVGGIRVPGVDATVIEGTSPNTVLLGMSYLKSVKFSEEGGIMSFQARY
ncbi:TIGR02281 family clan AA aspartic protease [Endozoicomonas sp. OPT23]|uniref:retropepsin-like aspartic protease family protein n=1 Tax=Endozoicomonas sp. OPT23 TaxID=2072845 RepID=UPI00129B7AAE|nr:TIGR02281 family clan AA aspartic protease [Endozoicomonas sp. OPT23]MRI32803.1 TIGR02281 family clan AA aspartic protease [Endozoicomonas sp. OPT23]